MKVAMTYIRSRARLRHRPGFLQEQGHTPVFPEGAIPKDGLPQDRHHGSDGIRLTEAPARYDIAMTGEITIRQGAPIGGMKEKTMALSETAQKP